MSKTFNIYIKNYETLEISTDKPLTDRIYLALNFMFHDVAMIDFKASLEGDILHIRTKDSEEFGYFCSLYSKAVSNHYEMMKVIALNKDV